MGGGSGLAGARDMRTDAGHVQNGSSLRGCELRYSKDKDYQYKTSVTVTNLQLSRKLTHATIEVDESLKPLQ